MPLSEISTGLKVGGTLEGTIEVGTSGDILGTISAITSGSTGVNRIIHDSTLAGSIWIVEGCNVTIDESGNTLTFNSTGGGLPTVSNTEGTFVLSASTTEQNA